MAEDLNLGYWETNPASGRVEALNLGTPDYNTSALNHLVTLLSNQSSLNTNKLVSMILYLFDTPGVSKISQKHNIALVQGF